MKVAVIGANGQLGVDLCQAYSRAGHEVIELNHDRIDVVDFPGCQALLQIIKPELLINTAAMHQVEACENDPDRAFAVNGAGARNLALLSQELGYTLAHISTDYVFDGRKKQPYVESDATCPLNVYGNTKLAGEYFVRTIAPRSFVVRVSGLFGSSPCRAKGGLNFVQVMLKLAKERPEVRVVDDEVLTPTCTLDIARQLERLTRTEHYGLYHMTAQGSCTWHEFAAKIFQLSGSRVRLSVADTREFPSKVPRPKYSVLANASLQALNLDIMPHWQDGLQRYLIGLKQDLATSS